MEWHYNFIIRTLKQHVCNKKDRMLELENRGVGLTNFNEIIKTCKEHNVLPAFLSVITKNTNYMAYSRMLKSEKMKNLIGHKILYKNCKNLFEQLECNNIKYAVLKGPYLAENAYGETGLRSSSDIDILVDKRNLENMYEILNNDGFKQQYYDIKTNTLKEYSRSQKAFYCMNLHQTAPFRKIINSHLITVDLNFSITWNNDKIKYVDIDSFLSDVKRINICGQNINVLTHEKNIIQICLHHYREMNLIYSIVNHKSINLQQFCDVYYYIVKNYNDIKWDLFFKLLNEYDINEYIYYILYYTNLIFDDDIFSNILQQTKPNDLDYLEEFGIEIDKKKKWGIDIFTRLFSKNMNELIKPMLNENELKKIETVEMYLKQVS